MAKLPATNALLACVAGAGLYIIYTTYQNMGGGALGVQRYCVSLCVRLLFNVHWRPKQCERQPRRRGEAKPLIV